MHRNLYLLLASLLPLSGAAQQHPHQHGAPAKAVSAAPVVTTPAKPGPSGISKVTGLESYQRFNADTPLADWRRVNDTVRDIGGWQTYAQEAARAIKAEQDAKATTTQGGKP